MTFSPYSSISKRQQKAQISQIKASQGQSSEDLDQLTPEDLFMDYSQIQIKQSIQQGDVLQNDYMFNRIQHQMKDKEIITKSQSQLMNQNSMQLFNDLQNYSNEQSQISGNDNFIFQKQQQTNYAQKVNSDINMLSNSESYILNSSKFINNNISSIIGNYSDIGNDNSNSIAFTIKQENNKSSEQNLINIYNNLNNSEQQSISQHYNNYVQSGQNAANHRNTNEFTRQSLKEQISQRLENSNQNTNFYKKVVNQVGELKDNQIINDYKEKQIDRVQLKANNNSNVNLQGIISKNNYQNNNQYNKILARRASMNDQSSIISRKQNQSYQSLFTQRQTSQINSNIESLYENNMKNQCVENFQVQNPFSKMSHLQLDQINSNQPSILKKQLLFSMIVETPDARQEVINVFEDDQISRLAYDFCIKNNMDLSKYCNFIIERLQEALNHYNSFQTPKNKTNNKQNNVFSNNNAQKFVNNQESAVFQVTQKGITPLVSLESNTFEFCSQNSFQNFGNQGNFIQNQENSVQIQNKSQNVNCSVSEQVFELPYKSLIYELKLSDLQEDCDLKKDQNSQFLKQIPNQKDGQTNEKKKQTESDEDNNQISTKVDPNSVAAITITLNPIENITQKMNEQINVKNIFEDQIQSQYQNIELLKQCIQKSLAQQQNIQQEFNRRRNNYSLQYESNKAYNSVEKSPLQKSINQESPNTKQQPQNENDQSSNHFNRYDILKYQESQESARQSKQFQFNQKASYSLEKYQSSKKEQAIQSGKYSVKIISPVEEMKYNDVSEFVLRQSENQQLLENQSQNLKLAAHLNVKNSSFYSPTSMNSVEIGNQNAIKEHKAFFFGLNQEQDQINQFNSQSKKHDLKSDLIQAQNLLKNKDVKVQKQNMSSLASQFDDFKNQDTNSLKSDLDKIYSNQDIQKSQLQTTNNKNYNNSQQNREISNMFDGITNYSSIQKDKQSINTESLRIFDEKQQEILPGLYKVCQTRIEEDEIHNQRILQQINEEAGTFNTNIPFNKYKFENYQQYEQNHEGNQPIYQQEFDICQHDKQIVSKQQGNFIILSQQQIDQSQLVNNQDEQQLTDITQQVISKQKEFQQQNSGYKNQQAISIQNNKNQLYNSASNKKIQYQLPPLSSNSKGHHQNSNNLSVQSSNRSLVNQNLSSVKRNLFSQNHSQKNLNQNQIQLKQQSLQYQNENQSFAQSNLSTARGSSCISSKGYDSNQTQQKTPNTNRNYTNQQINIFTARGSENQTQRNQDSFQILQCTPNTKNSIQQKRNNMEKQENFDQIKQTIFNSIMKSNPSQILSDVKQVKLNISPFIEQNKLNQQLQGPYSELYQKQLFKQQQQQLPREQSLKQNLSKASLNKQNINQKQKNNSLLHNQSNQQLNNNFKANNQQIQKRSSSFNLGRSKQNQSDNSFYSKQILNNSSTSLNKIKQSKQEIQKVNQEVSQSINEKSNFNLNFKQRIYQIFSVLDSDHDGYISSEKIDIKSVNDLVLFIITPILIEVLCINRSVNVEEFSCAFLKLFFHLPKQQQQIIIDQNVEISWINDEFGSLQNLEFFNFNSPLFQQYIDKKNTIQKASNKEHNWMLDLTNKEFLEFYVSNFKSLVNETNKYLQ
ncbi:hypothetical protein TTHERM_00865070 (macronuclear) [Tetrahymena thermophila SB210]|uniref:Uncharacterized protein n=1 Tax=Tetrahymena thermophila (strain SB210) TaxID=312017 RepID=Q24FF6_TETTS|nr:hypothetical protein TTHERM_00865070 [Tetrahymena thermophila SB210]EAS06502.2 hypothetical protein TTHERM_00865070 [Tetrahymena thermophila SB210]|eukprot:XP_001026747.2 hypothetical protein TTHERM_00865070 [Tetrahymena thermophila SB210]